MRNKSILNKIYVLIEKKNLKTKLVYHKKQRISQNYIFFDYTWDCNQTRIIEIFLNMQTEKSGSVQQKILTKNNFFKLKSPISLKIYK